MSDIEVNGSTNTTGSICGEPMRQPQVASRQPGGPLRALLAAVLSLALPGAGQIYLGSIQRGFLMLGVTIAIIGAGIGLWLQGSLFLLGLIVRPSVLIGLLAGNVVLLAFRLFAVYDAYRLGQKEGRHLPTLYRPWHRFGTAAILTVLLILAAAPHAAAGYYNVLTYDLLTDIFSSDTPTSTADAPRFTGTPPPVPTIPADL